MRKYHHTGFPTKEKKKNEIYIPELGLTIVANSNDSPYKIEKIRYDDCQTTPHIIKNIPHIAFEVENISEEIKDKKVLIKPTIVMKQLKIAFIEEDGIPIEFIQFLGKNKL